jgi:Sortase domain
VPLFAPLGPVPEETVAGPPPAPSVRVVRADRPSSEPVGLAAPAIGLVANGLERLRLDADRSLEAPADYQRAGWFAGGPAPGDQGPAVIVGHVDSYRGPGVFFRVRDLRPGEEVVVTRADGTAVRFVVDAVEQYAKDAFPADRVYGDTPGAELRLITCGGAFDRAARSYRDNVVVFASRR